MPANVPQCETASDSDSETRSTSTWLRVFTGLRPIIERGAPGPPGLRIRMESKNISALGRKVAHKSAPGDISSKAREFICWFAAVRAKNSRLQRRSARDLSDRTAQATIKPPPWWTHLQLCKAYGHAGNDVRVGRSEVVVLGGVVEDVEKAGRRLRSRGVGKIAWPPKYCGLAASLPSHRRRPAVCRARVAPSRRHVGVEGARPRVLCGRARHENARAASPALPSSLVTWVCPRIMLAPTHTHR